MGEYIFRERHVKLEREGDLGYLEEILEEKEEEKRKLQALLK